jgi:cell division protein FtsL
MGVEPVPVGDRGAALAARLAPAEPADLEKPRHLQAVPPRDAARTRRWNRPRVLALASAGLVLAVTFGLVYLHVVLSQRQFALDRLTAKVQAEQATYQSLRLRVAQSGSPAQIISTAEGRLGMRQPASVTYLTPTVTIGGAPDPAGGAGGNAGSGSVHAPAGDADWPQIKAQLAGSP